MKVCEHEIKNCPYCGAAESNLKEEPQLEPLMTAGRIHAVLCLSCSYWFYVPCED